MHKFRTYLITLCVITMVSWLSLWIYLFCHENNLPNSSLTKFAIQTINDIPNPKIVKTDTDNLFDIFVKDSKILTLSAVKQTKGWKIQLVENHIRPITINAPNKSLVLINGKILDETCKVETENNPSYTIIKESKDLPQIITYKLDTYFSIPNISATSETGDVCEIEINDRNVNVLLPITASNLKKFEKLIETAASSYAKYITNDETLANLTKHLYKNTPYYNELRLFFNDWYAHTGYDFRNMKISNIVQTADNAFEGDICFDYIQKKGAKEFVFPSNYHIPFIRVNGEWLAVSVEIKS